ncbi:GIY-YIG nuclease family protein [Pelagibacterales bacterium SAG-MED44]|nr:GIY-YIG nuclease family protein [Pelagibacterales bacterium SAG-MED44]
MKIFPENYNCKHQEQLLPKPPLDLHLYQERLKKHNSSKGAKFTRGRYWKLAYSKIYSSKSKAMKEEYSLKKNIILRNKIKSNFLNEDFSTSSV